MALFQPINKSFCLEQLCETNYQKLFVLCPQLLSFHDCAIGWSAQNTLLHLTVIERSPYTLTIKLSHCFTSDDSTAFFAPAVHIRIYCDAQLVEVLSDYVRPTVARVFSSPAASRDIMDYKWRLNIFLYKWLDHCVKKNYHFQVESTLTSIAV
jgi:uncharacterized protein YqiB (DUF1249 family)